jgi:quinol monooxygenase YgiN
MILIAGRAQVAPESRDEWMTLNEEVVTETRAEHGCVEFCFSADSIDPGLIRYFEQWESREDLDAHQVIARARPPRTAHIPIISRQSEWWEAVPIQR